LAVRAGAIFVAINRDPLLPIEGTVIPGCGAMVAAIEAASRVKPEAIGKPQSALLQEAMRFLHSQPHETVMIGDGLDTDIAAGKAAGTRTLLVLSGKDSYDDLARSMIKPDQVYENLAAVVADVK
jgi:HAD superfamily hydrolase (TIGR01450 family)